MLTHQTLDDQAGPGRGRANVVEHLRQLLVSSGAYPSVMSICTGSSGRWARCWNRLLRRRCRPAPLLRLYVLPRVRSRLDRGPNTVTSETTTR